MSYTAQTYENEKYRLKIINDSDPQNPRDDDNLGTMVCFHPRYNLGDTEHGFSGPNELMLFLKNEAPLSLPLFLLDHSGLWMRTGRFLEDPQGWDTSNVGVIYVTSEKLIEEYGEDTSETREKAIRVMQAEVETYSQYLSGDVWGYQFEQINGKDLGADFDSCWGFYGSDPKENGMWDYFPEEIRKLVNPNYEQNPDGWWLDPQLELPLVMNGG